MLKHGRDYRYVVAGGLLVCLVWEGMGWLGEVEAAPRRKMDATLLPAPEGSPLLIGPVKGLTSRWYLAPQDTSIPLGTVVLLRLEVESGSTVAWSGAYEIERDATHSTAQCPLTSLGQQVARAEVSQAGWANWSRSCAFEVVNISADQVRILAIDAWVDAVALDENSSNTETMDYYFGGSIAAVAALGEGAFATSVNRRVYFEAQVEPAGFAPLIEWRYRSLEPSGEEGAPLLLDPVLSSTLSAAYGSVSTHLFEVGPLQNAQQVSLLSYRTIITSHQDMDPIIPQGQAVTFQAVTDPPGFEAQIVWLASTKYGTGSPILGSGPSFTTQFDDTWGPHPDSGNWQWLGVKADNTKINQDQKVIARSGCNFLFTASALQFIELPAGLFGPDTNAFQGEIAFIGEAVVPGSDADTVLFRESDVTVGETTVLRLDVFRNVSAEPIVITGTGPGVGAYNIVVGISPTVPAVGQLTILSGGVDGGTYEAGLTLYPYFEFHPVGGGAPTVVDTANPPVPGFPLWLASSGGSWTSQVPGGAYTEECSSNFFFDTPFQIVRTDVGGGQYACAKQTALSVSP